jgi:hypothetical protein
MILLDQKLKEYNNRMTAFVSGIKKNFDMYYDDKHDDLNEVINFVNYTTALVYDLIQANNLTESIDNSIRLKNKSIEKAMDVHTIDSYFNKSKADKWLVNALVLIVRDFYTFDGFMFRKGEKKVLKSKLLKNG